MITTPDIWITGEAVDCASFFKNGLSKTAFLPFSALATACQYG